MPEENDIKAKTDDLFDSLTSRDYIHILVIGDSGAGKSSLIRLLTGDESIKIADSNDSESCTTDIEYYLYPIWDDSKLLYLYDTPGTQDTNDEKSDDQILNDVQRAVYRNNGQSIKIIWCVKPSDKKTPTLQKQAKFINKLQSEIEGKTNQQTIWDSVLMIVKKPNMGQTLEKNAQGAVAASMSFINSNIGCNHKTENDNCKETSGEENSGKDDSKNDNDNNTLFWDWNEKHNILGYDNVDWITDATERSFAESMKSIYQMQGMGQNVYYKKSNEIKELITSCLNKHIQLSEVKWKEEKCIKCGIIGDPRFVNDSPCHTQSRTSHKIGVKPDICHLSDIREFDNRKIVYHCGHRSRRHLRNAITKYHGGKIVRMHVKDWKFTEAGKISVVVGVGVGGIFGSAMALALAGVATAATETAVITAAVDQAVTGGAAIAFAGGATGTARALAHKMYRYPCCGGSDSTGCQMRYSCCKGKQGSEGCKRHWLANVKYPCCGGDYNNKGCFEYYDCCPFVDANDASKGCMEKCGECKEIVSGKKGNSARGCTFKWPCCGKKGSLKQCHENDASLHCQTICKACDKLWNDQDYPGCSLTAQHDMKPIHKSINE